MCERVTFQSQDTKENGLVTKYDKMIIAFNQL